MEANEVMKGNYISYENRYYRIHTIAEEFPTLDTIEFGVGIIDWNNIEPAEINNGWLENFGLLEGVGIQSSVFSGFITVGYSDLQSSYIFCIGSEDIRNVTYVHELQNIFFALTGLEFKIK